MSRRKSPNAGCSMSTIRSRRSRDHLDGRSDINREDNRRANERRREEAAEKSVTDDSFCSPLGLSYPSLGGGMTFTLEGDSITSEERNQILDTIEKERSGYWSRSIEKSGRIRKRWETHGGKFKALHQILVTVRPDVSMALMHLDQRSPDLLQQMLRQTALLLMNEFQASTGLEPVLVEVHSKESNLHFHLEFTTVNKNLETLWPKTGRGYRRLKLLGIGTTNFLRQVEGGFVDAREADKAYQILEKRTKGNKGSLPVDFLLAATTDAFFENELSKTPELLPIWEQTQKSYQKFIVKKRANRPEALKLKNRKFKNQVTKDKKLKAQQKRKIRDQDSAIERLRGDNRMQRAKLKQLVLSREKFEQERKATLAKAQEEIERLRKELKSARQTSAGVSVTKADAGNIPSMSPANKLVDRLKDAPEVPPACLLRSGILLVEVIQDIVDEGGDVEAFALWGIRNHGRFTPEEIQLLKIYVPEVEKAQDGTKAGAGEYPETEDGFGGRISR